MQAPDWYDAWCEEAFAAFTAKQQRMNDGYRLESWERYDYDAGAGTLTFSDAAGPRVVAEIQVLGSTSPRGWLWAWADNALPAAATAGASQVRAFGAEHGVGELTSEVLRSDDLTELGWMLAAIAVRTLDAEGAYSAPIATGTVFLVLKSLKFVS